MMKKVLKYIYLFVMIYLAIFGGNIIGAELMGDFDENTIRESYKVGLISIIVIGAYAFYKKQREKNDELAAHTSED